jgi:O-antigen/teichoic acid export membrane protein
MWATRVLLLVPQLILVPYLIGTIGESGYGIYALVWSLMISIDQMERSLQSGVVKYSAGLLAKGRMEEVNKVVSSSFVYSLLLAVLACAGTLVAAAFYNDPSGQIGTALVVVGIMVLFVFPLTPYIAVIQSRQCYYVGAIAETVSKYISLLAVVVWFSTVGPSIEALIIVMAGMLFLSRLAQVPFAYRLVPGLQNRPSSFDWGSFRLIAVFGAATVLASVCLAVNSTGVRWLMDALASTSFVAHLAIMLMPGLLLSQIVWAMTITVMPATSAYEATGNQRMLQELLIRGMRYTTIVVLAGLLAAGLLMRNVLSIWVGPDYVFLAPYALTLFASISFMLSTSTAHYMLKGMGRLRAVVFTYGLGLVIVPIGLIMVVFHIWRNPYVAATAGLATGHLVCGCLQMGFCARAVDVGLRRVFIRAYAPPLTVMAVVCLTALGIVTGSGIDGLVSRVCVSVLAVLLFVSGCYAFIATVAERQQVKGVILLAKSRIAPRRRMPGAN